MKVGWQVPSYGSMPEHWHAPDCRRAYKLCIKCQCICRATQQQIGTTVIIASLQSLTTVFPAADATRRQRPCPHTCTARPHHCLHNISPSLEPPGCRSGPRSTFLVGCVVFLSLSLNTFDGYLGANRCSNLSFIIQCECCRHAIAEMAQSKAHPMHNGRSSGIS